MEFTGKKIDIRHLNLISKYLNRGKRYSIHDAPTITFKNDLLVRLYYNLSIDSEKKCWLTEDWSKYSHITVNGKVWPAHRFSYQLFFNDLKDNLFVCHKCDRKGCRNPFHLFQGTHLDNLRDHIIKSGKTISSMEPDGLFSIKKLFS